jgi:hypothetical protein
MFRWFICVLFATVMVLGAIAFKWIRDEPRPVTSMSQVLQTVIKASFDVRKSDYPHPTDSDRLLVLLRACKPLECTPPNAPKVQTKWRIIANFKGRKYRLAYLSYYPEQHLLRLNDVDRPTDVWAESTPALDKLLQPSINTLMMDYVKVPVSR